MKNVYSLLAIFWLLFFYNIAFANDELTTGNNEAEEAFTNASSDTPKIYFGSDVKITSYDPINSFSSASIFINSLFLSIQVSLGISLSLKTKKSFSVYLNTFNTFNTYAIKNLYLFAEIGEIKSLLVNGTGNIKYWGLSKKFNLNKNRKKTTLHVTGGLYHSKIPSFSGKYIEKGYFLGINIIKSKWY